MTTLTDYADWKDLVMLETSLFQDALSKIDASPVKFVLVLSADGRLKGTVTDGDIRRGILRNLSLTESVTKIMNASPLTCASAAPESERLRLLEQKFLKYLPVVDAGNSVIGLACADLPGVAQSRQDNLVVLMAGGRGRRLRPLTESLPKPLLRVGDKPILETIIENLVEYGFSKFRLSVNFKADLVSDYFGDGSKWNASIEYLREEKPLGTAGSLALLQEKPDRPIIVMNGDLLTKVDFRHLLEYHIDQGICATMCVREVEVSIPYGVVKLDRGQIADITEKPVKSYMVNAGIYVLDPSVVDLIEKGQSLDMTELFARLIDIGMSVAAFPIREYWIDVGRHEDFAIANGDFQEQFS